MNKLLKNTLTHNMLLTILFYYIILYNILIQVIDNKILLFFSLEEKIHHSSLVSDYCHLFFRFMKLSDILNEILATENVFLSY